MILPTQEPGNGPCVGFGKDKNGAPARAQRKRVLWGGGGARERRRSRRRRERAERTMRRRAGAEGRNDVQVQKGHTTILFPPGVHLLYESELQAPDGRTKGLHPGVVPEGGRSARAGAVRVRHHRCHRHGGVSAALHRRVHSAPGSESVLHELSLYFINR